MENGACNMLAARETRGIIDHNTGRVSVIVEHDHNGGARVHMIEAPTIGAVVGMWHEFNAITDRPAAFGHFCETIRKAESGGRVYL